MIILCDTNSVLMLLRIVPDLLIDERYGCVIIKEVYDELVRTTKFKSKYPWFGEYKDKLKPLPSSTISDKKLAEYYNPIRVLNENGTVNSATGHFFDLSRVDMKVMACALSLGYLLSSGDAGIINFLKQEFPKDFKGDISPVKIINNFIKSGLLEWDDAKQAILADWKNNREHGQPASDKAEFRRLTDRKYPGS